MGNMYLVIDTTVPLHYKSIDHIDCRISRVVRFPPQYVPLVVIEELANQKDQHKLRKMRERARKALALIYENTDENLSGRLRNNVQLVVESKDPENRLGRSESDKNKQTIESSRLLYRWLLIKPSSSSSKRLCIKLTLRRLKLQSIELPTELQLEDALDESDREIKELRLENERLKSQFPKLCLESGEKSNRGLIVVDPELPSYSTTEQEEILERFREKYL